jgi:hypothetical protein
MERITLMIAGVLVTASAGTDRLPQEATEPGKIVIEAEELNTKYEIRGPLRVPLGQVITVLGQTVPSHRKSADPLFQVEAVNGRALKRPVVMPYSLAGRAQRERLATGRHELRGYQNGAFQGHRFDPAEDSPTVQMLPHKFVTRLIVIREAPAREDARKQLP